MQQTGDSFPDNIKGTRRREVKKLRRARGRVRRVENEIVEERCSLLKLEKKDEQG